MSTLASSVFRLSSRENSGRLAARKPLSRDKVAPALAINMTAYVKAATLKTTSTSRSFCSVKSVPLTGRRAGTFRELPVQQAIQYCK
jgi:hypothetical protein